MEQMQQEKQGHSLKLPSFSLLLCHSCTSVLSISEQFTWYSFLDVYVADARTNLNTISGMNEPWFPCGASEIC
jgi:hypothetical protein